MKGSFERFKATPTSLLGTSLNLLAGHSPPMFGALFLLPRSPTTHTSWAPCGWGCRSLLPFLCRELLHRGSHGPCPMGGEGVGISLRSGQRSLPSDSGIRPAPEHQAVDVVGFHPHERPHSPTGRVILTSYGHRSWTSGQLRHLPRPPGRKL